MSRTAIGWIPTACSEDARPSQVDDEEGDESIDYSPVACGLPDALTWEFYTVCHAPKAGTLLTGQQHVEVEAEAWGKQWGCDLDMPNCGWPEDLGSLPTMLDIWQLREALKSFPAGLGLGWDAIHPKALLRLGDNLLLALLRLLFSCECRGKWLHPAPRL